MELPQIGPNISVRPAGVRPATSDAASRTAAAFSQVSEEAGSIARWQANIDRAMHFASGDAEYVIGSSQIFNSARGMTDPNEREAFISKSLDNLRSSIVAVHKPAADKLTEQLGIRYADDLTKSSQQSIELADRNLKANAATVRQQSLLAASSTNDQKDRGVAINNYQGSLDAQVNNGMLTPDEAKQQRASFDYDLKKADYGRLAAEHPKEAMQVPFDKSGVSWEDWFQIQTMANSKINRDNDSAKQDLDKQKNDALTASLNGSASDGAVEGFYKSGLIDESAYKQRFHHLPTTPELTSNYMGTMDNWTGTSQELNEWYAKTVAGNPNLESMDHQQLSSMRTAKFQELSTEEGRQAQYNKADAKSFLVKNYPDTFTNYLNPFAAKKAGMTADLDRMVASLKGKSPDEQQKIMDGFKNDMSKKYAPIVSPAASAHSTSTTDLGGY